MFYFVFMKSDLRLPEVHVKYDRCLLETTTLNVMPNPGVAAGPAFSVMCCFGTKTCSAVCP